MRIKTTKITPIATANFIRSFGWVLLFIFIWFRGCSDDCGKTTTNVKVKVPEITGKFEPAKPDHTPVVGGESAGEKLSKFDKSKNSKSNATNNYEGSIDNDSLISELLIENEQLSRKYYFASDSLKKLMFEKSNQLNRFSKTFDDENVKIDVSGISRGTVESLTANYRIKEKELKTEIAQKEVKFRMLAGGTVGNSIDFQKPVFQANIGFQNKKGNILRAGYDSEKRIFVGYDFSIFKIQR